MDPTSKNTATIWTYVLGVFLFVQLKAILGLKYFNEGSVCSIPIF